MTREIESATQAAAEAATILPAAFVKLEFDSGDVCLWTGLGPMEFGGDTYTGAGDLGEINGVSEDAELGRTGVELSIRGMPAEFVAIALGEDFTGRRATIYQGYLNQTTMQLVDDPFILFRGRMDSAEILQGGTFSVSVFVESRFAAWDRPLVRRYNNGDQQSRYPGDKGLEFVEQTTDKQILWGTKVAS